MVVARLGHRYVLLVIGTGLVLVAAAVAAATFVSGPSQTAAAVQTVDVQYRALPLTVSARGLVRPAAVAPIKSQIASDQAQLVWLHEEGTRVEAGTLVARFDTKPFQDRMEKAERAVADAKGSLDAARKALEITREEQEGRLEKARRDVELARIKADDIKNGSGQLERKKLEQQLAKAKRAHEIARDELADYEMLLKKGHVSQRERDKAADELKSRAEELAVVRAELDNFQRYRRPKMLREASMVVEAAKNDLRRSKRTAKLQVQRAEGKVERYRRKLARARSRLKKAKTDLVNCDVYAPIDGVLLYNELPRQGERRKIQIGDSVWFGQTFMEIPDTSELIVQAKVREVDVAHLREGMPAEVRLDALPETTFSGEVKRIGTLAEDDKTQSGLRRFKLRVALENVNAGVHVGMSANVEVTYKRVDNARVVPIEALAFEDGGASVSVDYGDRIAARSVEVGAIGTEWAQIESGLDGTERVVVGGER